MPIPYELPAWFHVKSQKISIIVQFTSDRRTALIMIQIDSKVDR